MEQTTINIHSGNEKTNIVEDNETSKFFWNSFLSETYLINKEQHLFISNIDLMGNPINPLNRIGFRKRQKIRK
jgi:hypothetical protein